MVYCFCLVGLFSCSLAQAEEHEWTNKLGQTINAEFVSATNEAVTLSMGGKHYEIKLADLSPQSRALVSKLRVVVDGDKLISRDGFEYFEGKLFTGVGVSKYSNGMKRWERSFKAGKQEGLSTVWYEHGKLQFERSFKNGKQDGISTAWYANGQKGLELNFKDGEPHGFATSWYDNGQKEMEVNYKDGMKVGRMTRWYDNGQKQSEGLFERKGLVRPNFWDKNGRRMLPPQQAQDPFGNPQVGLVVDGGNFSNFLEVLMVLMVLEIRRREFPPGAPDPFN